jgi:hypothetical protein
MTGNSDEVKWEKQCSTYSSVNTVHYVYIYSVCAVGVGKKALPIKYLFAVVKAKGSSRIHSAHAVVTRSAIRTEYM